MCSEIDQILIIIFFLYNQVYILIMQLRYGPSD